MKELLIIVVSGAAIGAAILIFVILNPKQIDDPYGIYEAENTGKLSSRLIDCSEDQNCPEYAQALFWVAADILSKSSSETIEIEDREIDFNSDMSPEEVTEVVIPQLEELLLDIAGEPPNYNFADPEFKHGLELLNTAHDAGSVYASNELGLLFFEQGEMQNFSLAEQYFLSAWKRGDPNGAFNLARLTRAQKPSQHDEILDLLKLAAQSGGEDMKIMHLLGLEVFGNEDESSAATLALNSHESKVSWLRAEFNFLFGIDEVE